ncbi:MAG TPA: DEAD/DEAH box helicase, partial [Actinobacteria bacterium]|nr:DEAD/DEAH box helicase [Actinomycetota bacterium]
MQQSLGEPTVIQREAWPVLATGQDAVLIAPTGSGKTLAAFLAALDSLAHTPPADRKRVLYISPLKALASDIERNLRSPLIGLEQIAARSGVTIPPISVGIRTGDTPQSERTRQAKNPPDVWITTPESLFLLLTSRARDALRDIDTVIIDEVHALADSKRGAHLAVSLERLDALLPQPAQRIALSATVTPISEVARYVRATDPAGVAVISPAIDKQIELTVESPVLDFRDIGHARTDDAGVEIVTGSAAGDADRSSVWPAIADRVLDIITAHRSTIVFVNSRRLAERLTARLNDAAAQREEESDQST